MLNHNLLYYHTPTHSLCSVPRLSTTFPSQNHSHLTLITLSLPILSVVTFLKLTASSRPSAPPSVSHPNASYSPTGWHWAPAGLCYICYIITGPPSLASSPTARPVQAVSADISRLCMDWHRRTSPTSVDQSQPSVADKDSDPSLVATSLSLPLSRTLAPVHLLWRVLRPGINCRCTYEHGS